MSTGRLQALLRVDAHAELGEGPTWDLSTGDLLWVEIVGRRVHRFRPADGNAGPSLTVARDVGAVVPRRDGGLVTAVSGAFVLLEPGAAEPAAAVPVEAIARATG